MKSKGQALVEFVIILPIFLLLLLGVIDIGKIVYFGNVLEHRMDDVVKMYEDDKSYEEILQQVRKNDQSLDLEIANDNDEFIELVLIKKIAIITPGLNLIFDDPYEIAVKRVISYEK